MTFSLKTDHEQSLAAMVTESDELMAALRVVRSLGLRSWCIGAGAIRSLVWDTLHEFDQRSADLSVDHPDVVQNYRAAHDIALRHGRGEASTEDLRQAMIHYRMLFDDLVNEPEQAPAKAAS